MIIGSLTSYNSQADYSYAFGVKSDSTKFSCVWAAQRWQTYTNNTRYPSERVSKCLESSPLQVEVLLNTHCPLY